MKTKYIVSAVMSLFIFAGCMTTEETTHPTVFKGMSRNLLRANLGEPLRIETGASGGEDWYYRFSTWQPQPTGSSGITDDSGQPTTYVSGGLSISKEVVELPVHVSSEGFVVSPLPKGKVVKN
jgi:hypothetical protein